MYIFIFVFIYSYFIIINDLRNVLNIYIILLKYLHYSIFYLNICYHYCTNTYHLLLVLLLFLPFIIFFIYYDHYYF